MSTYRGSLTPDMAGQFEALVERAEKLAIGNTTTPTGNIGLGDSDLTFIRDDGSYSSVRDIDTTVIDQDMRIQQSTLAASNAQQSADKKNTIFYANVPNQGMNTTASPPTGGVVGDTWYPEDNSIRRWNGTSWDNVTVDAAVKTLAASKVTGQLTDAQLAQISAAKVAGQLTNAQLAAIDATKVTGQLVDSQIAGVSAPKISGTIQDAQLAGLAASKVTGQLTDAQVAALAATKLTGNLPTSMALPAGQIQGTVSNAQIGTGITASKIAGALTNATLAATAVTGTLTDAQLAGISAAKLTGQITGTQITDGAVTTKKLAAGSVTANEIAGNTITAAQIASGTITGDLIAANTIASYKLAVGDFTNLANDGDMLSDDPAMNWNFDPSFSYATDPTYGHAFTVKGYADGSHYAWLANRAVAPVLANEQYRLTFVVRSATGNSDAQPRLYAQLEITLNDGSKSYQSVMTPSGLPADGATWTPVTGVVTVPLNAKSAQLSVNISPAAAGTTPNSYSVTRVRWNRMNAGSLIVDGAIVTSQLAANAVTAAKIAANTITSAQLAAGAVVAGTIASNAVTTASLAAGCVTTAAIAAGAVQASNIAAGTITGDKIAANSISATHMVVSGPNLVPLPNWDATYVGQKNGAWDLAFSGGATVSANTGHNNTNELVFPASSQTNYAFWASDGPSLDDIVVTGGTVLWLSIWVQATADIPANTAFFSVRQWDAKNNSGGEQGITNTAVIPANTLTQISGQITVPTNCSKLTFSPRRAAFTAGTLSFSDPSCSIAMSGNLIVNGAVTAAKIAANTITAAQIAGNTITAAQIASATITATQLAANCVTANQLAANAVTAASIAAGTITATQMAAGTITAASGILANGVIGTAQIQDAAITSAKVASLDAGKVTTGTLSASVIGANSITGDKLSATSIDGKTITGATVQTATSGARTVMDANGVTAYNSSGAEMVRVGQNVKNGLEIRNPAGNIVALTDVAFGTQSARVDRITQVDISPGQSNTFDQTPPNTTFPVVSSTPWGSYVYVRAGCTFMVDDRVNGGLNSTQGGNFFAGIRLKQNGSYVQLPMWDGSYYNGYIQNVNSMYSPTGDSISIETAGVVPVTAGQSTSFSFGIYYALTGGSPNWVRLLLNAAYVIITPV